MVGLHSIRSDLLGHNGFRVPVSVAVMGVATFAVMGFLAANG